MTKQEEFYQMLEQVKSNRKKQLFALACCRSIEHLMTQQSKDCLEKFELFIDGKIDNKEFEITKQTVAYDASSAATRSVYWAVRDTDWAAHAANAASRTAKENEENERTKQIEFLKDIYNPNLLSLTFPTKAIQLAEEVYNTNNPITRLILSDFLEEFHFPEELYQHLKQDTHHKGCWVIDQILGKT